MSSEPVVAVSHLTKAYQIYDKPSYRLAQMFTRERRKLYRDFLAVDDVSFEIRRGESVGIIGRNGSGKSTLLQLICGTLFPSSGTVEVRGRIAPLLELGSGFNPEFSGAENIRLNAALLGLTRQQIDQRFDAIAAFADIGQFINQPVKTYSSGMYVRLAFAVIAHVDADILVVDEALAVGDAFFTQKCMRFLRTFMQQGTLVLVSHDTGALKALCQSALLLDKGRLVARGDTKTVCESYLAALYEATPEQLAHTGATAPVVPGPEPGDRGDPRLPFINRTTLRNDIRLLDFVPQAGGFGTGGATVMAVHITSPDGTPLQWIIGGEEVALHIVGRADAELTSPIVGFFIQDGKGQYLFGDNTFLTTCGHAVAYVAGESFSATFAFTMPRLPRGDYVIAVGVATGSQDEHEMRAWIHESVMLRSESSSVASGLIGIPMRSITLHGTSLHERS